MFFISTSLHIHTGHLHVAALRNSSPKIKIPSLCTHSMLVESGVKSLLTNWDGWAEDVLSCKQKQNKMAPYSLFRVILCKSQGTTLFWRDLIYTLFKAEILPLAAELKGLVPTSLTWIQKLNQIFGLLEAWIAPDKLFVVIHFLSFIFTTSPHLYQLLRRLYFCREVPEMFCGLQNSTPSPLNAQQHLDKCWGTFAFAIFCDRLLSSLRWPVLILKCKWNESWNPALAAQHIIIYLYFVPSGYLMSTKMPRLKTAWCSLTVRSCTLWISALWATWLPARRWSTSLMWLR